MEELRELLDRANIVKYFGGNPGPMMDRINEIVKNLEKDERMRDYWEHGKQRLNLPPLREGEESFCLLSRKRVTGITVSLNEMTDLFFGESIPREIRTERFLNCKTDILETLAKGVIHQSLTH